MVSWVLWGLSAISTFAGWTTVARHGMRAPAAWVMCVAVHAVLAWRLLVLVTE
ncbi:hypothetical protein [Streptomyces sp. H27-S2]|uniref:hypothetical protein n=1 Tax=Streptomyces antarcticus TaxID=2996458 RepID=UPI002271DF1C|nr:hypothetical protein [Streptomyces sp. H27-S2]MCY0953095.1 hypothetical protein [Streptomyces sp. H27-S2]